jgi:hypothetical protein
LEIWARRPLSPQKRADSLSILLWQAKFKKTRHFFRSDALFFEKKEEKSPVDARAHFKNQTRRFNGAFYVAIFF